MGIFDKEYEYKAYYSTENLIEDEDKKDTLNAFVVSALLHEDENIPDNIVAAMNAGFPTTTESYYQYGKKKYYWGVPESNFSYTNVTYGGLREAVEKHAGNVPVTYVSTYYYASASFYAAYNFLIARTWWQVNREYVDGMPLNVNNFRYRTIPDSIAIDATTDDPNRVRIIFKGYDDPSTQISAYVTKPAQVTNGIVVIYNKTADVGQPRPANYPATSTWPPRYIFIVRPPDANYPSLDGGTSSSISGDNDFLPIAVFNRYPSGYWSNEQWRTTLYKLLQKININAYTVYDEFEDAIAQTSADGRKLAEFFIYYGIPLTSSSFSSERGVKDYVIALCRQLYIKNPGSRQEYVDWLERYKDEVADSGGSFYTSDPTKRGFTVREGGNGFWQDLNYSFVEYYEKQGSAPTVTVHTDDTITYLGHTNTVYRATEDRNGQTWHIAFYFKNLELSHKVYSEDGYIKARRSGGQIRIPIQRGILKELSYRKQEQVLYDAISSLVTVTYETEIQWYEKTFWKGIFIIVTVAVVVAVPLAGGFVGVLNAVGITAGFALSVGLLLLKFAVGFLVSFTVSMVTDNAMITAIVTFVVMTYLTGGSLNKVFENLWSNVKNVGQFTFGSALQLIQPVSTIVKAGYEYYIKGELEQLQAEFDDLTEDYNTKLSELGSAAYAMTTESIIDPLLDLSYRIAEIPNESASDFYGRTINLNPGVDAFKYISNFAELTLALPKGGVSASSILTSTLSKNKW